MLQLHTTDIPKTTVATYLDETEHEKLIIFSYNPINDRLESKHYRY